MPKRVASYCINGCKGKGVNGSRLCLSCWTKREEHRKAYMIAKEKERTQREGSTSQRGYDGQWAKVSKYVRRNEPICRICKKALAEMVDHIIPLKQGGDRLALSNLQPLCNKCHNRKTIKDKTIYNA
jgi:5-methylcytosine-specific restriction protein A